MLTRPHRVNRLTFLIYSLDLLYKVTYIFWALTCNVALPSCIALISSFCTSSHDFDTHFLHFHLAMDSLCFSNWLAIYTSNTDFHRLAKRYACRTLKNAVPFMHSIFSQCNLHFIFLTANQLHLSFLSHYNLYLNHYPSLIYILDKNHLFFVMILAPFLAFLRFS